MFTSFSKATMREEDLAIFMCVVYRPQLVGCRVRENAPGW